MEQHDLSCSIQKHTSEKPTTDQQQGQNFRAQPHTLLCTHIWGFIIQCITIKMCMDNEEWTVWKYFLVWCNPCLNCRFIFLMNKLYSEATKQTLNNFIRPEGKTGEVKNDGLNFRIPRNSFPPHLHVSGGFEDRGITQ